MICIRRSPPLHLNSQLQLDPTGSPHEATLLNLSIDKAERLLGWKPKWGFEETIIRTVEWYEQVHNGSDTPVEITRAQIAKYQDPLE